MKQIKNPQKYVSQLTIDDMKKIFPENYYQKYATHLRILEFQKNALPESKSKGKLRFLSLNKTKSQKHLTTQKRKVKITRFDQAQQAILKNNQQLERMNKYAKQLSYKLRIGPDKKDNRIRINVGKTSNPTQLILNELKAHDDQQYEQIFQKKQSKKKPEETCNFTRKYDTKSKIFIQNNSSMYTTNSSMMKKSTIRKQNVSKVKQALKQILKISQEIDEQFDIDNKNDQRKYIMSINHAMKKGMKLLRDTQCDENGHISKIIKKQFKKNEDNPTKRRDLTLETNSLKQKVRSLNTLHRYDEIMYSRKIKDFLQNSPGKKLQKN